MKHLEIKFPRERAVRIRITHSSGGVAVKVEARKDTHPESKVLPAESEKFDYEFPHYRNQR